MKNQGYEGWAKAFQIFAKYEGPDTATVSFLHEVIYAGPNPENVSEDDLKMLYILGWYPDYQYDCFYHT